MRPHGDRRSSVADVRDRVRDVQSVVAEVVADRRVEQERIPELRINGRGQRERVSADLHRPVLAVPEQSVDGVVPGRFGEGEKLLFTVENPGTVLDAIGPGHEHDSSPRWRRGRLRVRLRDVDTADGEPTKRCSDLGDHGVLDDSVVFPRQFVLVSRGCTHAPQLSVADYA